MKGRDKIVHSVLKLLETSEARYKDLALVELGIEAKFYHSQLRRIKTNNSLYESLMIYLEGGLDWSEGGRMLYTKLGGFIPKK